MRSAGKQNETPRSRIRRAAVTAILSMLLTSILLLIVSLCVSKGIFPIDHSGRLVMLCAFLGALPASLRMNRTGGRRAIGTSVCAAAIFSLLLFLTRLIFETRPFFTPQLLKNEICATAGFLFGCAICLFRKPKIKHYRK
jgi:hypothetical protein